VREARSLDRLNRLGVATPPLVCHGARRFFWGMPSVAALVTREVAGAVDLHTLSQTAPECLPAALAELNSLLDRLHSKGWVLGAVKFRNVLLDPEGRLVLLDLPGMKKSRSPQARCRDRQFLP
jgi:hypothetical protein